MALYADLNRWHAVLIVVRPNTFIVENYGTTNCSKRYVPFTASGIFTYSQVFSQCYIIIYECWITMALRI